MMICSLFRNTMVSQHDGGKRETNPTCSINSNNKHNKTWCDDIFSLVQSRCGLFVQSQRHFRPSVHPRTRGEFLLFFFFLLLLLLFVLCCAMFCFAAAGTGMLKQKGIRNGNIEQMNEQMHGKQSDWMNGCLDTKEKQRWDEKDRKYFKRTKMKKKGKKRNRQNWQFKRRERETRDKEETKAYQKPDHTRQNQKQEIEKAANKRFTPSSHSHHIPTPM